MAKRFNGLAPLNHYMPKATSSVYRRRGFCEYHIIKDWAYIVGEKWAALTVPDKLLFPRGSRKNGTLYLRVYGAAALLIQYIEPEIVERANTYFGYQAIGQVKLLQAGLKSEPAKKAPILNNKKYVDLSVLHRWEEGELKNALKNLGQAMMSEDRS